MKILSLDISSKTGYCLSLSSEKGFELLEYGTLEKEDEPKELKYPGSYLQWSENCAKAIQSLIMKTNPDHIAIEETTPSRNSYSQKLLEWIHRLVLYDSLRNWLENVTYLRTGDWRGLTESHMNNEEKKHNAKVRRLKKKTGKSKVKIDGKVAGLITRKHVSVRRANELFNLELKLKDNDSAEAILICYAKHLQLKKATH